MNHPSFQKFLSLLLACSMTLTLGAAPAQAEELAPAASAETGESLPESEAEVLSEAESEAETAVEEEASLEEQTEPETEEEQEEPESPIEEASETPETDWLTARSAADVVRFLQEEPDRAYIREIEVDTRNNTVRVDGTAADLIEVFGEDAADAGLLDSVKEAERYLEETPFEPMGSSKGVLTVTAPYQSCRIVVNTAQLSDGFGAETVLEMPDYNQSILQFADEAATAEAYEALHEVYGDNCFVDEIIWSDEVLSAVHEGVTYPLSTENGTVFSWGSACIGTAERKNSGEYADRAATVAIIDTGIDPDNWFFDGRTISEASWDTVTGLKGRSNLIDYAGSSASTGHGTHVAGIVADCTPDSVELLIIRIFNDEGESSWSMVNSTILYAIEEGADIINLSLGQQSVTLSDRDPISEALTAARSAGVPVVCAAGNSAVNVANLYPASHPLTIAVSAITPDHQFASSYSNFGADIDFCAPGTSITSAMRGGAPGDTSTKNGTSMAAPHLTAAMTYLIMDNPTAGVSALYDLMKANCRDLGDEGKDNYFGWGCPVLTSGTHAHQWSESPELSDSEYRYFCASCSEILTLPVSCGENLTWSLLGGILTVSGSGEMADYDEEPAPWSCLAERIETVVIEKGVTSIGNGAFRSLSALKTLRLPQKTEGGTLTSIGEFAFFGCPVLENPTLPATLTFFGDGAFAACDSITRYTVENGSTAFQASSLGFLWSRDGRSILYACPTGYSINGKAFTYSLDARTVRPYAFYHCRSLSKITFGKNVQNIGEEAFGGCAALNTIYFTGDRPALSADSFTGVISDAAWSSAAEGWEDNLPQLGGNLAWTSYDPDLSDCQLDMEEEFIYTGKAIKPAFKLTSNGIRLDTTDYTAVFTDNVEPGTATLTLTGKSAYTGSLVKTFRITKPLTGLSLTVSDDYYTGKPLTPEILLTDGEYRLTEDTDFTAHWENNVEPGTATLTLTGMGLYTGTLTAEFTIMVPIPTVSITDAELSQRHMISVSWKGKTTAKGYQLQLATNSSFSKKRKKVTISGNKVRSYTFSGLKKGTSYYIRIRSYRFYHGKTYYSGWKRYKVRKPKTLSQLSVRWNPADAAGGYQVQTAADSVFSENRISKTVSDSLASSCTFSDLSGDAARFVRIRSFRIVEGKKVYSPWSVYSKTIKTK